MLVISCCQAALLVVLFRVAVAGKHQERVALGLPILQPLNDILLPRASRLHHLVDGAVAILREETLAEGVGHLVENLRLLVEPQILPLGYLAEDAGVC